MNSFILFPLFTLLITFPLLTYLLALKNRTRATNIFIIYLITALLWQCSDIFTTLTLSTVEWAVILIKLTIPCWLSLPIIFLHFLYEMIDRKKGAEVTIFTIIYIIILPIMMGTDLLVTSSQVTLTETFFYFKITPHFLAILTPLLLLPFSYIFYLMIQTILHSRDKIQQHQMIYIFTGTIITFSMGFIFNLVIPHIAVNTFSIPVGSIFMIFQLIAVSIAILHRRFLSISLDEVTGSILFEISDGVILLDSNNNIIQSNSAAAPLLKHLNLLLMAPVKNIQEFTYTDQYNYQEISLNINQTQKTFLISKNTFSQNNVVTGILLIIKDITEQANMVQQLQEATRTARRISKLQSNLLFDISHEIQHPLFLINQAITDLNKTDLSHHHHLEAIETAGQNLTILLNDILDLSRVEGGSLLISPTWFYLIDLLTELKQLFSFKIKSKGLKFNIHYEKRLSGKIFIDPHRLRQILINLINNAIKFTHKGAITLSIHYFPFIDDRIDLVISLSDTGIGIPLNQQGKIFAPFQQQEMQDNRKYGGTGLGLTIVREIVKELKGEITLESVVDQGSTFTIHLKNIPLQKLELSLDQSGILENTLTNHITPSINLEELENLYEKLSEITKRYQQCSTPPVIIKDLSRLLDEVSEITTPYTPLNQWLEQHQRALKQFDVVTLSDTYNQLISLMKQLQS